MTYELAKSLKEAGFPQTCSGCGEDGGYDRSVGNDKYEHFCIPTSDELLSELDKLVEYCVYLSGKGNQWTAVDGRDGFGVYGGEGSTPLEALAELYIAIHKRGVGISTRISF